MIEKMIPLQIPPGIVRNGTMLERAGRWADGNLVRFVEDGMPQAIGGFAALTTNVSVPGTNVAPVAARIWVGPNGYLSLVVGSSTKLYKVDYGTGSSPYSLVDLTPAGFTAASPETWQFDVLDGATLVAVGGAGNLYSVAYNATPAVIEAAAPATARGVVVTSERFVMTFDLASNQQTVRWASQGTTSTWAPSSTNSAGSLTLASNGSLVTARRGHGQTLVWSTADLWALEYVGAPLYYGARKLGDQCGIHSPRAVAMAGDTAFWMGERGFFVFDGSVRPLQCDIADAIFNDIASGYQSSVFSIVNGPWHEIWWFWPSVSGGNKVAIYNYKNQTWSLGVLDRWAGTDALWPGDNVNGGAMSVPILIDPTGEILYTHETGTAIAGAYLESGPFMLDAAGSNLVSVQKVVPDNNQQTVTEVLTLFGGTWPKVAETSVALTIPTAGGEPLDARFQARYIRFRQEMKRTDSRIGVPRIGVEKAGSR